MIEIFLWFLAGLFMMMGFINTIVGYVLGYAKSSPQGREDAQMGVVLLVIGITMICLLEYAS